MSLQSPFRHPYPVIGGVFIAFSCRRVLRSSLIFMQRLHDRTRISLGKRFPRSLFPRKAQPPSRPYSKTAILFKSSLKFSREKMLPLKIEQPRFLLPFLSK